MRSSYGKPEIVTLLHQARQLADKIAILLVANVKEFTDIANDDFSQSLVTEYFTESELEEITSAIRMQGIYVDISFNEIDFIKKAISKQFDQIQQIYKAVYNSAQSGKGPGRKSLIPAFCNLLHFSLIGSNAYVRSVCRHKYHYYSILKQHGIAVVESWLYEANSGWLLDRKPKHGEKVIAKPIYESASIGVNARSILTINGESDNHLDILSSQLGQPLIIQEFISGFEAEVPVIQDGETMHALGVIGISIGERKLIGDQILTYDIVYQDNYSFYEFNECSENTIDAIKIAAEQAAKLLGISGLARVDFRINQKKEFYITDISTSPHIVRHSTYGYLFETFGLPYEDLPLFMIALSAKEFGWI